MYAELPKIELFARSPRAGWAAWGNQAPREYDANRDFAGSLNEGYRAIRERTAAGGPGWEPTRRRPPGDD
jgi:hypothetical protein